MEQHPYADLDLIIREQAKAKANFCLVTGVAPSEYDELTNVEIDEFYKEYKRLHKS